MTLRVRLNVGALSRALGESEQAPGPSELDELVVPFLDIGPYLIASPDPSSPLQGIVVVAGGRLRELTTDPAAGADPSFIVPAGRAWKLLSIHGLLVSAAGGLTRDPRLQYSAGDGTVASDNIYLSIGPVNGQAPSESVDWTWASGGSRAGRLNFVGIQEIPPGLWVVGNGVRTVRINTTNLAVGDNWGLTRMWVEEFVTLD